MSAMRVLRLVLVAIFVLVGGCGGGPGETGFSGAGGSGGSGGGSGSSGGGGSGGGNGSSSGGSGSSSGGVTTSNDGGSKTVTLTMGPFTVPAGTEVFKCQNFANPFGGQDTDIEEWEEQMTEGSHHMFLFFAAGATDGPVQDCAAGGITFGPYPFGAQTPTASLSYPPGVGSRIPGSMGFMMNAHFVNASATPFQATLTVTMHIAEPGSVKQFAGVVFMNNISLVIPPTNTPYDATANCVLPQDMYVLESTAHMHQRADNFVAKTGNQTLYTTPSWSSPVPGIYSPPMQLKAGTDITWTCTYTNDTGVPLTFGESAERNVMCIYMLQFYPLADPSNPTIQCHT
jgi:hypothetical protein